MSHGVSKDRSEAAKHLFSLAVSLVVHAGVLGFLVVHFASVKLITFDKARVTDAILAPPLPPGLMLPKVGSMPSDLPPIEPDYLDSIPVRRRPPRAELTAMEAEAGSFAGSALAQGFRLDQSPPKTDLPSGDKLRLPIPDRRLAAAPGASRAYGPRENVAFETYLYSDAYGGLGAGLTGYSGVKPRRSGLRGGAYASAAVKGYDLTPWANSVAAQIQDKWTVPGTWLKERNKSVEITVVILKNGRIFSAFIAEPSDDRNFDESALEAVKESGQLPALPIDFPEASLEVSLVFTRQ
jgi:TonB family protein